MLNDQAQKEIQEILSKVIRVDNMTDNNRNAIPNQFDINGTDFRLFQSYASPIVMRHNGKTYIFKDYAYSKTTSKYRNQFLGETLKETNDKLKSGEYIAVDFEVSLWEKKKLIF